MKIIKCAIFCFLILISHLDLYSQDTLTNKSFLKDIIELSEWKDIHQLNLIYDLNVFDYFELNQYDTDLKKRISKNQMNT